MPMRAPNLLNSARASLPLSPPSLCPPGRPSGVDDRLASPGPAPPLPLGSMGRLANPELNSPPAPTVPPVRGELKPEEAGELAELEAVPAGSISREVRKESSVRPPAVEVRARKRSRSVFCSARRTPCDRGGRDEGQRKGREVESSDSERTHLDIEHLLEIGEGLTWNEEKVVLDELLGRIFGGHEHLKQCVDFEHAS